MHLREVADANSRQLPNYLLDSLTLTENDHGASINEDQQLLSAVWECRRL